MSNFLSKAFRFILQGVEPNWGQDYRGIPNSGVDTGATSQPTGLQQDAMGYGLGSDPTRFHAGQDQLHPGSYDPLFDAMEGLYTDARDASIYQATNMHPFQAQGGEDVAGLEYPTGDDPFQPGTGLDYPVGSPFQPGSEE